MKQTKKRVGRPPIYKPDTRVRLAPQGKSRLQTDSDRRRVVEVLLEEGGITTIGRISAVMGWDVTERVAALIRAGWLEVVP